MEEQIAEEYVAPWSCMSPGMRAGPVFLALALFCRSCFDLFQLISAYSLSHNTIELAEISRLFHQPNQPVIASVRCVLGVGPLLCACDVRL
jgi:hypothetical protein